jgi:2-polyprenyl-3-methyl-5-hydroxy-6-metoxy-1,4-benzoquinol methylase
MPNVLDTHTPRIGADASAENTAAAVDPEIYRPLQIWQPEPQKKWYFASNRNAYLRELATGRNVLHVGCGDWPCTLSRVRNGTLLHAELKSIASSVVGIDLEPKAIELLVSLGYSECIVADAETLDLGSTFECIIAGDVLEHVSNAGLVIQRLERHLASNGFLAIAVPSALSASGLRTFLSGAENVHKDHTAYYSPKTLAELCRRYGLAPSSLAFTVQSKDAGDSAIMNALRDKLLHFRPQFSPALVMTFRRLTDIKTDRCSVWR